MQKQTEIKFENRIEQLENKAKKNDKNLNNYFKTQQEIFDFMFSKLNEKDKLHVIELNKKQVSYLS